MKRRNAALGSLLVLAMVGLAPIAAADEYVMHGRVSFDAGSSMVKGAADSEWSHASVNTLILPGDTVWTDNGGTTEIEFSGGTFLRIADGSKSEIQAMPPSAHFRGWYGSFYIQRLSRSSGNVVFSTPACMVEIEQDTAVRVDVLENGATTVTVRWGRVTVRTDAGGATYVTEGRRSWIDPGMLPSEAVPFDRAEEDSFDAWNRARAEALAGASQPVPASVSIATPTLGASDLGRYGEWVYVDSSYYWRPTVVVNYVPYRQGYWDYVPAYGHVWVGNYPFSYVTSHYGRWRHHSSYGWIWAYDPVWAPAWVASVRCRDYFIWTPIDFYNRPVLVTGATYFSVGGVRFSVYSTSYAYHSNLFLGPGYVYGVHRDIVNYVQVNQTQINIWNISSNPRYPVRVPFERSLGPGRDFRPPRAIRGTETLAGTSIPVMDRVRTLESNVGRASFTTVERTGSRGTRTPSVMEERSARPRSVRVNEAAMEAVRPERSADSRAVAGTPSRSIRGGDVKTGDSGIVERRLPATSARADVDVTPSAPGTTRSRTLNPDIERVERQRTSPEGIRTRDRSDDVAPDTSAVRTPVPSRSSATDGARGDSIRRPDSTLDRKDTPAAPERNRTAVPERSRTIVPDTPRTSPPPATTFPERSRTMAPETRRTSPPVVTPQRTPVERSQPRVVTTSPSIPRSDGVRSPDPGLRSAPPVNMDRRSSPRVTTTSPSIVQRSEAAPSRTAPERSISRSAPAPSRTFEAPPPIYSAPSPSPAPSRSFSAPSPAPSRSFSTPSPAPSRSFSTPSPAPSRSYSAPSPAPSRSFSAPSPAPSRSFSAPSRSDSAPSAGGGRATVRGR